MKRKLFTKSAFKIALECPRRLYYAYDSKLYANQQLQDDFLQSLARGGFQVGELAKVYYGIKVVLPSVLNSSDYIKAKYSEPVYGTDLIPSKNLKDKVWIKYDEDMVFIWEYFCHMCQSSAD